jgi:hypothetical protein
MPVLRISEQLYNRLAKHADGFDTPAQVVERILNRFENIPDSPKSDRDLGNKSKPLLSFQPNETEFHQSLVEGVEAKIIIHYQDGSESSKTWRPNRYTESSNLRGNIWSGFLRGWKDQDIVSAEFHAGSLPTQLD